MTDDQLCAELERLVDATTLARVLEQLHSVCSLKADHLRANWQDPALAREWERIGAKLGRIDASGV